MTKDEFLNKITKIYEQLKNNLLYFFDKGNDYPVRFFQWVTEVSTKNKIILENKRIKDREMARRRRSEVYWIDFGVNVGSEFNYPHFCVVLKESKFTAIVVPISSVKEDTPDWKDSEDLIVGIGLLDDLPREKRPSYALVNQIRTVSKQRLSNYKDQDGKYLKIKLSPDQMDIIDNTIMLLCKPK